MDTTTLRTLFFFLFFLSISGSKLTVGSIPSGWTKLQLASEEGSVSFNFILQRNLDVLKQLYDNITNPNHPQWRQFLSPEEVVDLTKPDPSAFLEFDNWVNSFSQKGQLQVQKGAYTIQVTTTVSVASALFQTSFYEYGHNSGHRSIRVGGTAVIPSSLESKIASIPELTELHMSTKYGKKVSLEEVRARKRQTASPTVTPAVLKQAYGINYVASPVNALSLQAIVGLNDSFSVASLNQFRKTFNLSAITIGFPFGSNCINMGCDQVESDLDVQYITATGDGIPTIFVNSLSPTLNGLASAFTYLDGLASGQIPYTVSLSYGFFENALFDQQTNGENPTALSVETTFMSLGVKGVSIFVSSGDGGVSGDNQVSFTGNNACELNPSYPATSPYVTAVGATQLVGNNNQKSWQEIVAETSTGSAIISAGGFSWFHPAPTWQTSAIAGWTQHGPDPNIPAGDFFSTNRGLPDISLVGHFYEIYSDGTNGPTAGFVDGTSCSSPALAGMISLINNALLNKGAKTVGPLGPVIYQLYSTSAQTVFNQVTSGTNPCLPARSECCTGVNTLGFTATVTTWSPTIGIGTPKFAALMNAIVGSSPTTGNQNGGTGTQQNQGTATGTNDIIKAGTLSSFSIMSPLLVVLAFLLSMWI